MASLVLSDAKLFIAGADLSGQMNAIAMEYGADMLDATTFGNTTRINKGGLKSVVVNAQGLWDASSASAPDPAIFDRIGVADHHVLISPTGVVGETAFLFRATFGEYTPGAAVGELFDFSVTIEGDGGYPAVRGAMLHNGSATGDTTGVAVLLGAVSATQFVYGVLEVMSGTGDFTAKIQSDDNPGFTTPTDRITFTTVSNGAPSATDFRRLAGPVTDTYWRVVTTNPNTRNFAVAVGIQ